MHEFLAKLEAQGSARVTILWYKNHLLKFSVFVNKPFEQVSDDEVYSFRDTIEDRHTQYNALRCVKRCLRFYGNNIDIVLPKYVEKAVEEYQPEELRRLFAAMDEAETRLWSFYRMTGCREGEVSHAVWENLHRNEYVVKPFGDWTPKKLKTRRIPIPDALWNLLTKDTKAPMTGLMFPNQEGNPDGHHLRKLKWVAIRAGLDQSKFWLHKFRSSFATTHLRNGATVNEVAGWLGHSDLTTVMRYLALTNNDSDRVRLLANGAFL